MKNYIIIIFFGVAFGQFATTDVAQARRDSVNVISQWKEGGITRAIALRDTLLFAGYDSSLVVLNVSDPNHPEFISRVNLPILPYDIVVRDDYAFVAGGHGVIMLSVQIRDPNHMVITDRIDPGWLYTGKHLTFRGDTAFVSVQPFGGSSAYDISNPFDIRLVSDYGGASSDVIVVDTSLYVLGGFTPVQLKILSWNPFELDEIPYWFEESSGPWFSGEMLGNQLFMVGGMTNVGATFYIYDATSDRTLEKRMGELIGPSWTRFLDLALANDLVYIVGDGGSGLLIVDAVDPAEPETIARFETAQAMDVAVADSLIYLAAGEEGVYVLRNVSKGPGTGPTGSDIEDPADVPRTEAAFVSVAPNPVAGSAVVRFRTARTARVRIALYDVLGRRVDVLLDEIMPPGEHALQWDTPPLPSGTYFVTMEEGGRSSLAVSFVR